MVDWRRPGRDGMIRNRGMRVVVRIRGEERRLRPDGQPNRSLAGLASAAIWPLALLCFCLCGWRWAVDLGWLGQPLGNEGILSHWQVWFVAGALWQALAVALKRYAEAGGSDAVARPELLRKELP